MRLRRLVFALGGLAAVGLLGFAGWLMLALPEPPKTSTLSPIAEAEVGATLAALKPPKRQRPLIAVVGINDATETTDYLVPYGILRRADVADVLLLSTQPGPVSLYPALKVLPDMTTADFDGKHPTGADYVVVPAMSRDDDPRATQWIRAQADRGATIVGVCYGVKVVAAAGLLDGRRATTHWHALKELLQRHPTIQYVPNRRLVVDRGVATTTGITASMPMMLTLIEAIAGRDKALAVAADLGISHWDARHDSSAFKLTRPFVLTVIGNVSQPWRRERFGLTLVAGIDEVSLALVADAWSRTYRSSVVSLASSADPVVTRSGLAMVADQGTASWTDKPVIPAFASARPSEVLDQTLQGIAQRYGSNTGRVVAMQLEYPHQR